MLLPTWNKIKQLLKNKYLLATVIFAGWLIFFDNNNLIVRYWMLREVRQLEKDYEYYEKRIISDSIKLHELKSSPEMLEKFAREEYLMKKENEDIFIIVEE